MGFNKITVSNPIKLPPADVRGIFLHWTAGRHGQQFPDYHFLVDADGSVYQNNDSPPGARLEHTWHRNTGTIGIAAMAMLGATETNYGPQAFTREQLEAMCALAANLARKYGIALLNIMTHAEAAAQDGYGPGSGDPQTRWDWWKEGDRIHKKIAWYFGRLK